VEEVKVMAVDVRTRELPLLDCSTTDDPRVVQEAATEDYSLHVAPRSWRLGRVPLMMAWSSLLTAIFWVVVGATLGLAVGTRDAITGMVLAVVAYGLINYVFAVVASRTGLTVALLSRGLFGYFGAAIATLVFAAGAIYFATFEGSVLAIAFQAQFGGSIKLWYLLTVLYALPLVIGGVRQWLDKLNAVLLPVFAAGLIGAVIWAIADYGYSSHWLHLKPAPGIEGPGWMFAFTVYMGVWLITFYTVDFGRFGRLEDRAFNGWVTFGPIFYIFTVLVNGLVGMFLVGTLPAPATGVTEGSVVVGIVGLMGIFGVIFIFATQTKINSANLYLASTNLESFFARALGIRLPRWFWVFVAGLAVYLFMLSDVFSFLLDALNYQAVVVVAWIGIALVELAFRYANAQRDMDFRPGRVPGFNVPGLVVWALSSAVGIYALAAHASFAATWGPPLTFVIAAVAYAAVRATVGNRSDLVHRPNDVRDEVSDEWETRVRCHRCERSYIAIEMDRDPSAGHQAICASCATGIEFFRRARHERIQPPSGKSTTYPTTRNGR
jgi:purine-cytosine permease-like protein